MDKKADIRYTATLAYEEALSVKKVRLSRLTLR